MDVPGTIRKGCGFAAGCLTLQFPHVIKEFPEIRECHMGTINVVLDISLIVVAPDYRTQRIAWDPSRPEIIEDFGFLRIQFEHPSSGQSAPAWIYISSGSPYRRFPHMHEVIAKKLENLAQDTPCRIKLMRPAVLGTYGSLTAMFVN